MSSMILQVFCKLRIDEEVCRIDTTIDDIRVSQWTLWLRRLREAPDGSKHGKVWESPGAMEV